ETASSTVLVTCDSSSAGAAPNCAIATETRGTSTFGMRVIASLWKLRYPSAQTAAAMTMGGSGLRMAHAEMLSAIRVPPPGTPRPRRSDQTRASLSHINDSEQISSRAARPRGPTLETEDDLLSYHWAVGPSSETCRRASRQRIQCAIRAIWREVLTAKSIIEFGFKPWMNGSAPGGLGCGGASTGSN